MHWKKAWKELPEKDGIYLCQLEDHYGVFQFENGQFQPNDWGDYCGLRLKSSYVGCENCITFWCELPEFESLTENDIKELKTIRKIRNKNKKRSQKENAI